MNAHTPGPWMHLSGGHVTTTAGPDWAAHIIANVPDGDDLNKANTRLITAAPYLLAALKDLLSTHGVSVNNNVARARAAIAKAEGKS